MDRRIWTPDGTCKPFYLNTTNASTPVPLFKFRVPGGQIAVIRKIYIFSAISQTKAGVVIKIVEGDFPQPPGATWSGMGLTGALTEVQELDSAGTNLSGLGMLGAALGEIESCIILLGGNVYQVVREGSVAQAVHCAISGWIFPANES